MTNSARPPAGTSLDSARLRSKWTVSSRPREIQARIRAGASVEQVAEQAGIPHAKWERFAYPVCSSAPGPRRWRRPVIRYVRTARPLHTLSEIVTLAFKARGPRTAPSTWDAWKDEDGFWVAQLQWQAAAPPPPARWRYQLGRARRHHHRARRHGRPARRPRFRSARSRSVPTTRSTVRPISSRITSTRAPSRPTRPRILRSCWRTTSPTPPRRRSQARSNTISPRSRRSRRQVRTSAASPPCVVGRRAAGRAEQRARLTPVLGVTSRRSGTSTPPSPSGSCAARYRTGSPPGPSPRRCIPVSTSRISATSRCPTP